MTLVSYPSRQRGRRLACSLRYAIAAVAALLLAVAGFRVGLGNLAVLVLMFGALSGVRSRHWLRLARRSKIGARSEQQVRARLGALEREGWQLQHSLRWPGGGDIDHLAIAPPPMGGLAFAIETKTRSFRPGDLARISAIAHWLARRHGRSCRDGALPVLCLAGTVGVERWQEGVAIVSADRLVPVLRRLAGTTQKPRFLR